MRNGQSHIFVTRSVGVPNRSPLLCPIWERAGGTFFTFSRRRTPAGLNYDWWIIHFRTQKYNNKNNPKKKKINIVHHPAASERVGQYTTRVGPAHGRLPLATNRPTTAPVTPRDRTAAAAALPTGTSNGAASRTQHSQISLTCRRAAPVCSCWCWTPHSGPKIHGSNEIL